MSELYIGFMSGTSLDGIDASLIKTDGINKFTSLQNIHIPYSQEFKSKIKEVLNSQNSFLEIEKTLTELHIEATNIILKKSQLNPEEITAIGFHGQTIFHNPKEGISLQIGNPHLLAQKTGIKVVHDFRRRDISLGGEGAPLVPIFHKLLLQNHKLPSAIVNIGGVANLTYVDHNQLIAFDTGPGNALIDDAMKEYFDKDFDDQGKVAQEGTVNYSIANKALEDKYFLLPFPKSLDRNHFKSLEKLIKNLSKDDIISTLTYITSLSIAKSIKLLPKIPQKIFLCGGGSKNKQIVSHLKEILSNNVTNTTIEDISLINNTDPEYVESQAFAYLAARFIKQLPSSFPSTTGTQKETICGCLVEI